MSPRRSTPCNVLLKVPTAGGALSKPYPDTTVGPFAVRGAHLAWFGADTGALMLGTPDGATPRLVVTSDGIVDVWRIREGQSPIVVAAAPYSGAGSLYQMRDLTVDATH